MQQSQQAQADGAADLLRHTCPAIYKGEKQGEEYMCFMTGNICPYFAKQECNIFMTYIKPKEAEYEKSREVRK